MFDYRRVDIIGHSVCPAVAAEVCFRSSKNIDDKAEICGVGTRWPPTSCKWSYNPYK